jgi:hypothetical protein
MTMVNAKLVLEHVRELGDALSLDMMDSTWGSLSCSEAEMFAGLFRAADYTELADSIIEQHAWHDEEGDQHYDPANDELHRNLHAGY